MRERTFWGGRYWDDICFSLLQKEWAAYQTGIHLPLPAHWVSTSDSSEISNRFD